MEGELLRTVGAFALARGWGLEVSCDSVLLIGLNLNRIGKRINL